MDRPPCALAASAFSQSMYSKLESYSTFVSENWLLRPSRLSLPGHLNRNSSFQMARNMPGRHAVYYILMFILQRFIASGSLRCLLSESEATLDSTAWLDLPPNHMKVTHSKCAELLGEAYSALSDDI